MVEVTEAPATAAAEVRRQDLRAYRLLIALLFLRPFGNLTLAWGMKHAPQVLAASPLPFVKVMLNPYVAGGITMLILSLLVRMALLSIADLSFVLPLTALGYVISTALGRFLLAEHVNLAEWTGTVLVFLGSATVGFTRRSTNQLSSP